MDRRQFLARTAVVGLSVVGAGCSTTEWDGAAATDPPPDTPSATPTDDGAPDEGDGPPHAGEFESVVDVAEAGGDPTGTTPVDSLLADRAGDDVLLYFPEGEYLVEERVKIPSFSKLGLVGPEATVVAPEGYDSYMLDLGRRNRAEDLLLEGLEFDFSNPGTGPRALNVHVDDGLRVRDLTVRGVQGTDQTVTRFAVTSPGGSGTVERLHLPDGGGPRTAATGCLVPPVSAGTLTFRDCRFVGFPSNGLYASAAEGRVRVLGGLYANNGIANVRVGGDGVVRGVRVRCDAAVDGVPNMRGIRIDGGSSALVENCVVELLDVTGSDGAVTLSGSTRTATLRNTRIRVDADGVGGVVAKRPPGPGGAGLRCEGVSIEGSAARDAAVTILERDGSVLDGVTICQSGANRDGVEVLGSTGCTVRDATITVTRKPLVVENSDVATADVNTGTTLEGCLGSIDPCPGLDEAVQRYAGPDCEVGVGELREAIGDWTTGEITSDQLQRIVFAWARS